MWQPADFPIARIGRVDTVAGYVYRGLGMFITRYTQKKREPVWSLTHLNTGHGLAEIRGRVADAFPIATKIAECTEDWEFMSLVGWRDRDPELPAKVLAIIKSSKRRALRSGGRIGDPKDHDEQIARAVLEARETTAMST